VGEGSQRPGLLLGVLHLAAIWTVAVVQPHFDLLSNGEAFVHFGWGPLEILVYALVVLLAPALVLGAVELIVAKLAPERRWDVHLVFVGALCAVLAANLIKRVGTEAGILVFLVVLPLGVGAALAYNRLAPVRSLLSFLSVAPAVVLAFFVFAEPVGQLVFGRDEPDFGSVPAPRPVPVVLIVFDEFPAASLMSGDEKLDAKSVPNFAELARSATWYRNATTAADATVEAVPAVITGNYPDERRPPSWRAHPATILNLVGETHELDSFEGYRLCDPSLCAQNQPPPFPDRQTAPLKALGKAVLNTFMPRAVIERLPFVDPTTGRPRTYGFDEIDQLLEPGGAAEFVFIHSPLPHGPWSFLPSGQQVEPNPGCCITDVFPAAGKFTPQLGLPVRDPDEYSDNQDLIFTAKQAHLLQVQYTDRLLGDVLRELKAEGMYDESLIVVTADHGVSFEAGSNRRLLLDENAPEILNVPLFVKTPGQSRGSIDDAHVSTVDIAPTIASALGTELPWESDGYALPDPEADRDPIRSYSVYVEENFEIQAAELDSARRTVVREADEVFGPGRPGLQPFAFGPAPRLWGTRPGQPPPAEGLSVFLHQPFLFADVDLDTPSIPIEVSGAIFGEGAGDVRAIAVGLNGRIAATASTYDSAGVRRFRVRVSPSALREGENRVDVYSVTLPGAELATLPPAAQPTN